jgi:protein-S-isoprenylcysteine O-methyltransferase Ste14
MSATFGKIVFLILPVGWYIIRMPYARRSRRTTIVRTARGFREMLLLSISFTGVILLPFLYVATDFPRFAAYPARPVPTSIGVLVAIAALIMFHRTHKALGRNWSVSLDVRENHRLVTEGVYRHLRHPMYTAFWLWAAAQALLLPNWIAGLSGLFGFGTLYFLRIGKEEQLMLDTFGDEYRVYMARTRRIIPWIY